jgi:chorismate-pyruvate lyase
MKTNSDLFYPMNEFYGLSGVPLPQVTSVEGSEIPEPCRGLLVHSRDMTSTLTEFYGQAMLLHVLKRVKTESVVAREIILVTERDGRNAVYAANKIYLDMFTPEARQSIFEERIPFGGILAAQRIAYKSRPIAFFKVTADETINRALGLTGEQTLYGRRNELLNENGEPLARVLEIVPPGR